VLQDITQQSLLGTQRIFLQTAQLQRVVEIYCLKKIVFTWLDHYVKQSLNIKLMAPFYGSSSETRNG